MATADTMVRCATCGLTLGPMVDYTYTANGTIPLCSLCAIEIGRGATRYRGYDIEEAVDGAIDDILRDTGQMMWFGELVSTPPYSGPTHYHERLAAERDRKLAKKLARPSVGERLRRFWKGLGHD